MRRAGLVLLLASSLPAVAEVYKCLDADGNVTYTNARQKGCTAMDIEPYREPAPAAARPRPRPAAPGPANFPSVDRETQKHRDQGRYQILATELTNEEKLLADARRYLAEGDVAKPGEDRTAPAYAERVRKLRDAVRLHEQNVAALRRELANVK
jgi:hypothetical protein